MVPACTGVKGGVYPLGGRATLTAIDVLALGRLLFAFHFEVYIGLQPLLSRARSPGGFRVVARVVGSAQSGSLSGCG